VLFIYFDSVGCAEIHLQGHLARASRIDGRSTICGDWQAYKFIRHFTRGTSQVPCTDKL